MGKIANGICWRNHDQFASACTGLKQGANPLRLELVTSGPKTMWMSRVCSGHWLFLIALRIRDLAIESVFGNPSRRSVPPRREKAAPRLSPKDPQGIPRRNGTWICPAAQLRFEFPTT